MHSAARVAYHVVPTHRLVEDSLMASQSVAGSKSMAAFIPDLERLVAEAMDEWKVPGLALAVVQNGEVALVRADGHRNVEAGLPVTTDTQFLICSELHQNSLGLFENKGSALVPFGWSKINSSTPPSAPRWQAVGRFGQRPPKAPGPWR